MTPAERSAAERLARGNAWIDLIRAQLAGTEPAGAEPAEPAERPRTTP